MALMSTPPLIVRPVLPTHLLNARASRVIESSSSTTSLPISARRLQRSTTSWERRTWLSMSQSRLLATTSPLTARFMSVTSSGRSSIKSTMSLTSGKLVETPRLMCCSRIVLPARGGETIKARWPLPSGVKRSITRVVMGSGPTSSFNQDSGLIGVSSSKLLTFL